jgi:dienelactone hydrolase
MPVSIGSKTRKFTAREARVHIFMWMTCLLGAGTVSSQTLHGFVLTGNPAAAGGATWTYRDTVNGVIYDLQGILLKPSGTGKLPGAVISHGHGGNVNTYSINIAQEMRSWGVVCIATNYTHSGGVPIGSPGDSTQPGASMANIQRAHKCAQILASLGYVDTTRLAAHGNSMGAFLNAAVVGVFPALFRVASHSGGGVYDYYLAWTKTAQADGITAPYQIHHGGADSTVPLKDDQRLDSLLQAHGVQNQIYVYPGYSHTDMTFDTTMYKRVHTWYTSHGLFTASGVEEAGADVPRLISLSQNYPNPFNPSTTITYSLPAAMHVNLKVYDILGRELAAVVNEIEPPGVHSVRFDASQLSSGVYYYRIAAGSFVAAKQMLVVR